MPLFCEYRYLEKCVFTEDDLRTKMKGNLHKVKIIHFGKWPSSVNTDISKSVHLQKKTSEPWKIAFFCEDRHFGKCVF